MTSPGIPNDFVLSTACFGTRLAKIEDQIFAAVAMGFRRIELGLSEVPPSMEGLDDSVRETSVAISSLVAGCRDARNGSMAAHRLGSLSEDERERAISSVRRHVRLAQNWQCPVVVVRGSKVEDNQLRAEADALEARILKDGLNEAMALEVRDFVQRVQRGGQTQVEHLCRSLHLLMQEFPETSFAIEPGSELDDLLGLDAMGWMLDDLGTRGLGYWHDVGHVHMRSKCGLPEPGQWLEQFGSKMLGIHLQDAAEESEMPLGLGEVDFKLVASYVPRTASRVLELNPRHGRAEILASIQFLVDKGF